MDLEYLLKRLKAKYPLFRLVTASLSFAEDETCKTACTDGYCVWYSQKFMDSLTPSEQLFVLAHEICHVALDHLKRRKDKNAYIWNIATDAVINALLVRDGLTPPNGLVFIDDALSYSSEELYKKLLENAIPFDVSNAKGKSTHERWGMAIDDDSNTDTDSVEDLDDKGGEKSKPTEAEVFNKNKEARDQEASNLKNKLTSGGVSTAPLGQDNSPIREKDKIIKKNKIIDFRKILRTNATYELDYSYKNATIEDGIITAHLEEEPFCTTEVLLDTSGSISKDLLMRFLGECLGLLDFSKLRVGCFDTSFYGFQTVNTPYDLENIVIKGGGGTSFYAAARAFSKLADNKIVFTDGQAYYNGDDLDIIWIVFGTVQHLPKNAKVILVKV